MQCRKRRKQGFKNILGERATPETLARYQAVFRGAVDARRGQGFERDEWGELTCDELHQRGKAAAALALMGILQDSPKSRRGETLTPSVQAGYAALYDEMLKDGVIPEAVEWDDEQAIEVDEIPLGSLIQARCGCIYLRVEKVQAKDADYPWVQLVKANGDCWEEYDQTAHGRHLGDFGWSFKDFMVLREGQPLEKHAPQPDLSVFNDEQLAALQQADEEAGAGRLAAFLGLYTELEAPQRAELKKKILALMPEIASYSFPQQRILEDALEQFANKGLGEEAVELLTQHGAREKTWLYGGTLAETVACIEDAETRQRAWERSSKWMDENVDNADEPKNNYALEVLRRYGYSPEVTAVWASIANPFAAANRIQEFAFRAGRMPKEAPEEFLSFVQGIEDEIPRGKLLGASARYWKDDPRKEEWVEAVIEIASGKYITEHASSMLVDAAYATDRPDLKARAWETLASVAPSKRKILPALGGMLEAMPAEERGARVDWLYEKLESVEPKIEAYRNSRDVYSQFDQARVAMKLIPHLEGARREKAFQTLKTALTQMDSLGHNGRVSLLTLSPHLSEAEQKELEQVVAQHPQFQDHDRAGALKALRGDRRDESRLDVESY